MLGYKSAFVNVDFLFPEIDFYAFVGNDVVIDCVERSKDDGFTQRAFSVAAVYCNFRCDIILYRKRNYKGIGRFTVSRIYVFDFVAAGL